MTTIVLSEQRALNDGKICVFGTHADADDRFVFGVRSFRDLETAERYARRMMERHEADHFERIK